MKNIITGLLLLGTITSLLAQTKKIETYHDIWTKTKIKERYYVETTNMQKHGEYKLWDNYGNLALVANYYKGNLHGKYINYTLGGAFCEVGKPMSIENYQHGKKHGVQKYFDCYGGVYGGLKTEQVYENDVMVKETQYYKNGNKKSFVQVTGVCYEWYESGQKSGEYYYKNNIPHGKYTYWYENKQTWQMGTYNEGNKIGKWITFFENSKVKKEEVFEDISIISISSKEYYPDGKIKSERVPLEEDWAYNVTNYDSISGIKVLEEIQFLFKSHGDLILMKHGLSTTFYPNGEKEESYTYYNNIKHGPAKAWYSNGKIYWEGNFDNNNTDGEYKEWFENGQLQKKGIYKYDYKHGKWVYYNDDGSFRKVELYNENPPYLLIETITAEDIIKKKFDEIDSKYITQKKKIYKAYEMLKESLLDDIDNTNDISQKRKATKDLSSLCDKMLELIKENDTKDLEKQLKGTSDPKKIKEILGI